MKQGDDAQPLALKKEPPEKQAEVQYITWENPAYKNDPHFYRVIAYGMVAVAVASVLGFIGLSAWGKTIPEGLVALGSAAIGALAAVFTSGRGHG